MNIEIPSSALIEKLINEDYKKDYGTNGTEESRQQRIIGAKFIISWLANNHINGTDPKEEKNEQ